MATTVTQLNKGGGFSPARSRGNRTLKRVLVNLQITSYTTNGETLPTAASMGLKEILGVFFSHKGTTTAYLFNWDSASGKVVVLTATGTEASGATNVGHVTAEFIGR